MVLSSIPLEARGTPGAAGDYADRLLKSLGRLFPKAMPRPKAKPALMRRMPRRRRKSAARGKEAPAALPAPAPPDAARGDPGGLVAAGFLVLAIAAAGLVVDSGADASFDAPKRVATLLCVAAAALAAFGFSRLTNPFAGLSTRRVTGSGAAPMLFLVASAAALLAALFSPHRAAALDATRALFLYSLLLPLGASRVVEKRRTLLLAGFLSVAAINAVVSALQARGIYQPFALVTQGRRNETGAFVGNAGSLALVLALAAVASVGLALLSGRAPLRVAAGAAVAVFSAGLLVSRNMTSWSALLAGAGILLLAQFGRRAAAPIALVALLASAAVFTYPPMRHRAGEAISAFRARDWDRLVTYRLGAWAAAIEMTRDRPWTGFGPGTYGAELVPHRLRAEIETRRLMANPEATSAYGEAHCDYLQVFAEAGIPAGVALLGAIALVFAGLLAASRRLPPGPDRGEAVLLLAFLGAGAVAALTWFPLQRPLSAVPLLLAAGRAWRISTPSTLSAGAAAGPGNGRAVRLLRGLLLAGALLWALAPELPRYRAERLLRPATDALRYLVTHPGEVSDSAGALGRIEQLALSAASGLPGDSRPWILAGSSRLAAGNSDRALDFYRTAFGLGERAEIDLNIGRALESRGEPEKAMAAYLRAVWIAPALIPALLPDVQAPLRAEYSRLLAELRSGRLRAPPPPP
jgi:O-antigen ligase